MAEEQQMSEPVKRQRFERTVCYIMRCTVKQAAHRDRGGPLCQGAAAEIGRR